MPQSTPLQEASNPATDPARLRQLAQYRNDAVKRALWRNPSLPEDVWRTALLEGEPETWANPMAPIYVLTWTPREDDVRVLERAARWAAVDLWREPERCSLEGKALLNAKVQEGWLTCESTSDMMNFLGGWAYPKKNESSEHREVVRILVLCVRTAPHLSKEERQALDILEAWTKGGQDRWEEAYELVSARIVADVCWFAKDAKNNPSNAIYEVLKAVEYGSGTQGRAEHERMLTDLIRREMPLPPVVA
jgi:hypothetical protein